MNYENLLDSARALEKELSERMKTQQKLSKSIQKSMENGDLESWLRVDHCLCSGGVLFTILRLL